MLTTPMKLSSSLFGPHPRLGKQTDSTLIVTNAANTTTAKTTQGQNPFEEMNSTCTYLHLVKVIKVRSEKQM